VEEKEEEAFWTLESVWARIRVACRKSVLAALLLGILALSAAFAACQGPETRSQLSKALQMPLLWSLQQHSEVLNLLALLVQKCKY
jgi:hypothetical protein